MEIKNKILISITKEDLVDGVFFNDEIIEVANECFYNMPELKVVNLPNATTFGSDCLSYNYALTSVTIQNIKFNVKNIDGYCFVIEKKKKIKNIHIYAGYNINRPENKEIIKENCFVAEKDNFYAHGNTIKKAIQDVEFKAIAEKLKSEPINEDTIITINYYRTITGACEYGVKNWMAENKIEVEEITAKELIGILRKTNAYGLDKFESLVRF